MNTSVRVLFVIVLALLGLLLNSCVGDKSNSPQSMVSGKYNIVYSNGLINTTSNSRQTCTSSVNESGILEVNESGEAIGRFNSGVGVTPIVYTGVFTNPINNLPDNNPCFTADLDQLDFYPASCDAITSNSYIQFVSCINYANGLRQTFKAQYFVYTRDPANQNKAILVLNGSIVGNN